MKTNFVSVAHELTKTLTLSVRVCDNITQLTPAFCSINHSLRGSSVLFTYLFLLLFGQIDNIYKVEQDSLYFFS